MGRMRKRTWEPSAVDYRRVFTEQNPWRETGKVPAKLAFDIERPLARKMYKTLSRPDRRRFQLVLGPRRVGKTVSMYQTVRHLLTDGRVERRRLWWLHMAHPLLMDMPLDVLMNYIREVADASDEHPAYLFLDEVTYATDWSLWLKDLYDRGVPVRVMATSSSTAALRHGRLESGVGRWDEQYLSPYLFDEYLRLLDFDTAITPTGSLHDTLVAILQDPPAIDAASLAEHRRRYLLTGGFPELLLKDEPDAAHADLLLESQRTLGKDAVQRAVYQDIPQVYGIDNPMVLERLLYLLAGQLTGILSPKSICSELDGLSQPTFDKYLGYLEHSFIVFTLQNYAATEAGKQKRGRKLYFIDGAVRNAALQRGLGPLTDTAEMGLLIENLVAAHLHALGQQAQVRVHYWRRGGDEVDFIYDHPTAPLAFEVGMSASHSRKGLQALKQAFPKFNHRCFVVSPDANLKSPESAFDGIGTLPIDLLLVAISSQAAQNLQHQLGVTELDGKPNLFAQ